MIHRVRRMDCCHCGNTQRCRYRLVGDTEIVPVCAQCGHSDSWLSLPTGIDQIVAEVRREACTEMLRQTQGYYAEMLRQMFGFGHDPEGM